MRRRIVLLVLLLLCVPSLSAQETGFLNRRIIVGSTTYRYQVYIPVTYSPTKKLPVILYLHGLSLRGDDGVLQTDVGLGAAIRRRSQRFPAIVVFPQCRLDAQWAGEMQVQALKALGETVKEFKGDSQRLYLTGYSMGGYGAWYMAALHPGKFAAVIVIAGAIFPHPDFPPLAPDAAALVKSPTPYATFARLIGKTPVWIFHGEADEKVAAKDDREMAGALKAAGGSIRYTEYGGQGHGIVDKAYAEEGLREWLFAQRLTK